MKRQATANRSIWHFLPFNDGAASFVAYLATPEGKLQMNQRSPSMGYMTPLEYCAQRGWHASVGALVGAGAAGAYTLLCCGETVSHITAWPEFWAGCTHEELLCFEHRLDAAAHMIDGGLCDVALLERWVAATDADHRRVGDYDSTLEQLAERKEWWEAELMLHRRALCAFLWCHRVGASRGSSSPLLLIPPDLMQHIVRVFVFKAHRCRTCSKLRPKKEQLNCPCCNVEMACVQCDENIDACLHCKKRTCDDCLTKCSGEYCSDKYCCRCGPEAQVEGVCLDCLANTGSSYSGEFSSE